MHAKKQYVFSYVWFQAQFDAVAPRSLRFMGNPFSFPSSMRAVSTAKITHKQNWIYLFSIFSSAMVTAIHPEECAMRTEVVSVRTIPPDRTANNAGRAFTEIRGTISHATRNARNPRTFSKRKPPAILELCFPCLGRQTFRSAQRILPENVFGSFLRRISRWRVAQKSERTPGRTS